MSRTPNTITWLLAAALAAAALAPAAAAAQSGASPNERTPTELAQAVGEPGEEDGAATTLYSRTPTELGQRVPPRAPSVVEARGFDWGDGAVGALIASGLILVTVAAVRTRHRRTTAGSHA